MSEPTAEERFRHALRTTVADVMPHLAQSLERAFDEVMAGRAVQDGLDVERLAQAMKAFMGRPPGWMAAPNGDDEAWALEAFRYAAGRIAAEYDRAAPPLHDLAGETE